MVKETPAWPSARDAPPCPPLAIVAFWLPSPWPCCCLPLPNPDRVRVWVEGQGLVQAGSEAPDPVPACGRVRAGALLVRECVRGLG